MGDSQTNNNCILLHCVSPYYILSIQGLEIMANKSSVMMTGQIHVISFHLIISHSWLNITGQNDQQGKDLTVEVPILARHKCQLTGYYFKPCP